MTLVYMNAKSSWMEGASSGMMMHKIVASSATTSPSTMHVMNANGSPNKNFTKHTIVAGENGP